MSDLKPCPFCGNKEGLGMGISGVDSDYVYCQCNTKKIAHGWNLRPIEQELMTRAEAAERENERLTNFYKQAMNVASSIYAACTYQTEADAASGNYGLPKKVWDALDKLIQDAHDLSDHKGEQI